MQSPSALHLLTDFASQINFSNHHYIEKSGDNFILGANKAKVDALRSLITQASSEAQTEPEKSQLKMALTMIQTHLSGKISGIFSCLIAKEKKSAIDETIKSIKNILGDFEASQQPTSEPEARLRFYKELPSKLRVRSAAKKDLEAIKLVSQKLWDRTENYDDYSKYMRKFFKGEHMLFEEESEGFELYDQLKDDKTTGAYLRGSSHYDHGTLNGKTGGPVPKSESEVKNPQYEIEGPQIKALLVGRVKLATDGDKPIFGKTFDQIAEERKKESLSSKNYTFLQTEWAPDSSSWLTSNFWKHRVLSFFLYAGRKTLGFSKPNVGPYGYGHGDTGKDVKSNPTVIPLKKVV